MTTDFPRSYYGNSYDRYIERSENSPLRKMQQQYWVTKQAVLQKFGRKEDEYIVASDAELDAKLELYRSIEHTSFNMQKVIEMYQDKILALSQDENCMGRFLKEQGKVDKTRAGKMMMAAGKSLSYTAQQRLSLRVPLVRLYQEVETFRSRAIADTLINVTQMENARTEYRGALLWMKDVSQELDPDTYKQLDKFRKVQNHVRRSKTHFDKLKVDCLQKIDLLAASRCNMFSHALAVYQNTLLSFWKKTSKTMASVAETFKGYQHYEFCMLKELTEPSKKLAEETSLQQPAEPTEEELDKDRLIFFDEYHDDENEKSQQNSNKSPSSKEKSRDKKGESKRSEKLNQQLAALQESSALLDLDFGNSEVNKSCHPSGIGAEKDNSPSNSTSSNNKDLLTNHTDENDEDKDDLSLLNEILNMPTEAALGAEPDSEWQNSFSLDRQSDEFVVDWQAAFTNDDSNEGKSTDAQDFLPSQLLNMNLGVGMLNSQLSTKPPLPDALNPGPATSTLLAPQQPKNLSVQKPMSVPSKKCETGKDKSVWFNLFADLDPLSNPDTVGKKADDVSEQDRNC